MAWVGSTVTTITRMDLPEIDIEELERHLAGGAALFDVREDDEYATAHIAGAVLVPLGTVPDEVGRFPTDETVYVICAKGGRSARAVEFLRGHGVDAVNVTGGMTAWVDAGKPNRAGS